VRPEPKVKAPPQRVVKLKRNKKEKPVEPIWPTPVSVALPF
jgi:hypothetical protein